MSMVLKPIYLPNIKYNVLIKLEEDGEPLFLQEQFGVILSERPKFTAPEVKTEYVDILGANGRLDLTGAVDGKVYYGNFNLELKMIVHPDAVQQYSSSAYTDMMYVLLGRKVWVLVDRVKDPGESLPIFGDEYYEGRILTIENDHDGHFDTITMTIELSSSGLFNTDLVDVHGQYDMPIVHEANR